MAAAKAAAKGAAAKKAKAKVKASDDKAPPWDQENPKGEGEHTTLTPKAEAAAKRRAKATGRPYPNLVDNLHAAAESKK